MLSIGEQAEHDISDLYGTGRQCAQNLHGRRNRRVLLLHPESEQFSHRGGLGRPESAAAHDEASRGLPVELGGAALKPRA